MVSKADAVLQSYLLQSLNMALGALMQGETSYTNSFNIVIQEDGFIFIPRLPCAYILDDELYNKIFLIANASLYPHYTLLKQNATYFVPLKTDDIHVQRGLFFRGGWEFQNDWSFLTLIDTQQVYPKIKFQLWKILLSILIRSITWQSVEIVVRVNPMLSPIY